jgi:hypothetical protein
MTDISGTTAGTMYADADKAAENLIMADIEGTPAEPEAQKAPPAEPATPDATQDQPPVKEESFLDSIDPAELKGENLALYKQMQADYTKKTQEISEYRELGHDAATLQQSVDFTTRLTNDPQYASEVVKELYDLVKEQGLDPLEGYGTEEALVEVTPPAPAVSEYDALYGDNVPADLQQTLSQLTNDLETMKQAEANRTEQQEVAVLQAQIDKQELHIKTEHPAYDENDIAIIHRLAWSTEGNLLEANDIYQKQIHSRAEHYLEQKKTVGGDQDATPSTGTYSEKPKVFDNLDDPELQELALLRLTQAMEDN